MKIIKPSVELINFSDNIQQIGYAASVCYNSDKKGTISWLAELWKNGHKSVFRHGTLYFVIPAVEISTNFLVELQASSYTNTYFDVASKLLFLSTNLQFTEEHTYFKHLTKYQVSELNFMAEATKCECDNKVRDLLRVTFKVVTQVSTSRELNRVSPNNICEQSTRYCNFSSDKYNGNVVFCQPHWMDCLYDVDTDKTYNYVIVNKKGRRIFCEYEDKSFFYGVHRDKKEQSFCAYGWEGTDQIAFVPVVDMWIKNCLNAEDYYKQALKQGMKPQDARGLLPLDLATTVVYTYSIKEWKHFIDLRYYGTTGKPHPNAKLIAAMIKSHLDEYKIS